ncbi:MAG: hypothetical protein KC414_11980, partial [Romboutsia sp.]|nr:hypothetical protein [Romboutsia sp.]
SFACYIWRNWLSNLYLYKSRQKEIIMAYVKYEDLGSVARTIFEENPEAISVKIILASLNSIFADLVELRNNTTAEGLTKWDNDFAELGDRYYFYIEQTDNLQESILEDSEYWNNVIKPLLYENEGGYPDVELPWILANELLYEESKPQKIKEFKDIIKDAVQNNIDTYVNTFNLLVNTQGVAYAKALEYAKYASGKISLIVEADVKAKATAQAYGTAYGVLLGAGLVGGALIYAGRKKKR